MNVKLGHTIVILMLYAKTHMGPIAALVCHRMLVMGLLASVSCDI